MDDEPQPDDDRDEGDDDERDEEGPRPSSLTNDAIGPVAAVAVGFAAFYLSAGLPFLARLGIALVVMTIVVYITVEIARRRRRR